ncbi:pirin-like bicupin family protein [Microlunatus panaciterrae]
MHRGADRFATRTSWLDSRHCFSFGAHYEPTNTGHGRLLVSNDDIVLPGAGFDTHPHADAEIVTWVLSGSLVHQDSQGNHGVIYPGLAQRMSAGAGILHSERNDAYRLDPDRAADPVHFVQMWVRPDEPGTPPSYQQRELEVADLRRGWLPVASGRHSDAVISIGSRGSTLWVTRLGADVRRELPVGDTVHLYVAAGEVDGEEVGRLRTGDSVRITGRTALSITGRAGSEPAEVLVWEMAR